MTPRHALALLASLSLVACPSRPEAGGASTSAPSAPASAAPSASAAASAQASAASTASAASAGGGPRLQALGVTFTRVFPEPHFPWRLVEGLNWQGDASKLPPLAPVPAASAAGCPAGMRKIEGNFLVDRAQREDTDEVQTMQDQACAFWRTEDHGLNGLCDRFDRGKWLDIAARLPRKAMRFCVDQYEYPNAYGEFPLVVVTFSEAEKYCAREGKRLCTESEWTFACEGEEGQPYPYGYERDMTRCNIGVLGPGPGEDTFKPRFTEITARGIDTSWRGKRSGEVATCVSPFGVNDMTGNVDEWTTTVRRYGYRMIMKGGHWGPARQRCRPQTRGHGPRYVRYDQGFRCCQDAP